VYFLHLNLSVNLTLFLKIPNKNEKILSKKGMVDAYLDSIYINFTLMSNIPVQ